MTSSESHQDSSPASRFSRESEENSASQPSISPANPSRTSALGWPPLAPRITSGTPIPVAEGRPFSPGTNVSQIASRLALAASLSWIVTVSSSPPPPRRLAQAKLSDSFVFEPSPQVVKVIGEDPGPELLPLLPLVLRAVLAGPEDIPDPHPCDDPRPRRGGGPPPPRPACPPPHLN